MASRECTECGHETDATASSCGFCGAPRLHKPVLLARPGIEAVTKWGAIFLVVYGVYHLATQMG